MNTSRVRRLAIWTLAISLAAVMCAQYEPSDPGSAPRSLELRLDLAANLEPFDDCEELLDYFVDEALESVTGGTFAFDTPSVAGPLRDAAEGSAAVVAKSEAALRGSGGSNIAAAASAPAVSPGFSATNIQEGGVDEPDIVKTDGDVIAAVARGRLFLVEAQGSGTRVAGSIELPEGDHEIFLHDDRVIVLTRSWQAIPAGAETDAIYPGGSGATIVTAVDIADLDNPHVAHTATFEGDYVTARLHEGVVRLVLQSAPTYLPQPAESTVRDWLPDEIDGDGRAAKQLVPCEAVSRPPEPAGPGTVTVLTIDAARSMDAIDTDAVVASAQTVYASADTLYIATNQWLSPAEITTPETYTTELHAFDIADPAQTTYLASGRVRGQLLNQWSLSEHNAYLRVATTEGSPWAPDGQPGNSESFLTVLERSDTTLQPVGQVGGLGRTETIQAVRFMGDVGFVVTFRRTDPLYALDLSDPTSPKVTGELKVPGFSAYLHPVGEGRLLGVGQDATDEGRATGTQVSLFDTSDLANPERLDNVTIPGGWSEVESDHKAFLWWADAALAVVPVVIPGGVVPLPAEPLPEDRASSVSLPSAFSGVVAFRIDSDDVKEHGRVSHDAHLTVIDPYGGGPGIQRALVVGGDLYTVSSAGIMATDLASLTERAWAGF